MTGRFSLATLLRVRRIQLDLARGDVASAQAAARQARSEHARREALLDGRPAPGTAESSRWLAMVATNLAMAGDAYAAKLAAAAAADGTTAALDAWARAGVAHQGIERLAERHAESARRERDAAEQRAADDRAGADSRVRQAPATSRTAPA
jgi:hypothetical protein